MIDLAIVKTLNTKNISSNTNETRRRLDDLWSSTTKMQKEKAVEIGGYTDTRSFNKTRTSGLISARMVIALALALNVDPFYINADLDDKADCTDEKVMEFMRKYGFGHLTCDELERPTKAEVVNYISKVMDNMRSEKRDAIKVLSNEELRTLLDSILIRSKLGDEEDIRLFIIKVLLISN